MCSATTWQSSGGSSRKELGLRDTEKEHLDKKVNSPGCPGESSNRGRANGATEPRPECFERCACAVPGHTTTTRRSADARRKEKPASAEPRSNRPMKLRFPKRRFSSDNRWLCLFSFRSVLTFVQPNHPPQNLTKDCSVPKSHP